MQVGQNQNVKYKGVVYHIQTEDGGRNNPVITTLLFKGGTILASRRTSYQDIVTSDQLSEVVKDIIKDQHKSLLLDLKHGRIGKAKAASSEDRGGVAPVSKDNAEAGKGADQGTTQAAAPQAAPDKSLDDIILEHLSIKGKK